MKKIIFLLASVLLAASTASADPSGRYSPNDTTADEYLNRILSDNLKKEAEESDDAPSTKWEKAIQEEAFKFGVQSGAYWESKNVLDYLTMNQVMLDTYINFEPLLLKKGAYKISPPVVLADDGRAVISDSGRVLRILDKTFIVEVNASFVYGAKSWREYLYVIPAKPGEPDRKILPRNDKESRIWDSSVRKGWNVGVKSIKYSFQTRMARLYRDYVGMTRYHLLRKYNMVGEPEITSVTRAVTGSSHTMNVNDTVITIKKLPLLNLKKESWVALSTLPETAGLFPNGLEDQALDVESVVGFAGHMQKKLEYANE